MSRESPLGDDCGEQPKRVFDLKASLAKRHKQQYEGKHMSIVKLSARNKAVDDWIIAEVGRFV